MSWLEKHSVNCYFCGKLFDERDGQNADSYNNNNGGSICPECLEKIKKDVDKDANLDYLIGN